MKKKINFTLSLLTISKEDESWIGRVGYIAFEAWNWSGSLLSIGREDGKFKYNFLWHFKNFTE